MQGCHAANVVLESRRVDGTAGQCALQQKAAARSAGSV